MKTLITLAGIAIALAAPAHASPTDDYLDLLSTYGLNVTSETGPMLITMGNAICKDLEQGDTAESESAAMFRILPNATEKQSGNLVTAAQIKLCPDTI